MLEFSIIIPYYNKRYEIDLILMALSVQDFEKRKFEVVIIDDGSDQEIDDLIEFYGREHELNIRFFRRPHCGNRGQVRNYGVQQSQAPRLILLDSDMVPEKGMLKAFSGATSESKKLVSLGCRNLLIDYDHKKVDRNTICNYFDIFRCLPACTEERIINITLEENYNQGYAGGWQLCFSHCLCLWKDEFIAAGGFDEMFSKNWGAEDVELGYRLYKNGCSFKLNYGVMCHHISHPVNFKKNILSLRKNYQLFILKHPNWQVELFTREYETWAVETIAIEKKILAHEYLIKSVTGASNAAEIVPEKTLLVGIADPLLLNLPQVKKAFVPNSPISHEKIEDIIGIVSNCNDDEFVCAIVSAKLRSVNEGLYKKTLDEISRIAYRVIVLEPEQDLRNALATPEKKSEIIKQYKYLLFSLSNENFQDPDKNNMLNLALAMDRLGIKTGIQSAFDPFNIVDINYGYAPFTDTEKLKSISRLKKHEFNFFAEDIPHLMDFEYLPLLPRSIERKVYWHNKLFENRNDSFKTIMQDAEHILFRRKDDMKDFSDISRQTLPACGNR